MAVLSLVLLLGLPVFLLGVFIWAVLKHFLTAEVPSTMPYPVKLRFLHCLILYVIALVSSPSGSHHELGLLSMYVHLLFHLFSLSFSTSLPRVHYVFCICYSFLPVSSFPSFPPLYLSFLSPFLPLFFLSSSPLPFLHIISAVPSSALLFPQQQTFTKCQSSGSFPRIENNLKTSHSTSRAWRMRVLFSEVVSSSECLPVSKCWRQVFALPECEHLEGKGCLI